MMSKVSITKKARSRDVIEYLDSQMVRKPMSLKEVPVYDPPVDQMEVYGFIKGLPELEFDAIYDSSDFRGPTSTDFITKVPQWFVMVKGNHKYLVNTEGATHARYMLRLP